MIKVDNPRVVENSGHLNELKGMTVQTSVTPENLSAYKHKTE